MLVKQKPITFEQFCATIKDGQKADLIDGVIHMASPDNTDANKLGGWLYGLLSFFVAHRQLGEAFHSRVAFRLGDRGGPEPDIAFIKKSRLRRVKRGYVAGPPDLAMEVVSLDSIVRDYQSKREQYENAGVKEYWIIDEIERKVILLRLGRDGKYKTVSAKEGVLQSKVVKGFWLQESWLWTTPLPDAFNTLELLLKK